MIGNKDIEKGIVVRGLSKNKAAFDKEELDEHGRLQFASVNCIEGNMSEKRAMEGMDKAQFPGGYASNTAEKIKEKQGRVMRAPVPGNPNHCQIFGLDLKTANNLFSNRKDWPKE